MSRRTRRLVPLSQRAVPETVRARLHAPLVVVLGSPGEVVNLLRAGDGAEAVCYQMDLYQAERLREGLERANIKAKVITAPDLWDLPVDFQTAVYMPARGGERELKIDVIEQTFHVLKPGGALVVWSSFETDPFFPSLLKKVFGRPHEIRTEINTVLWAPRAGDRPRRRHEVTFQARVGESGSCRFVSRPGVFTYGRFDDGARALAETAVLKPGDRVLDLGCGCGVAGVFASRQTGPEGHIAFVDSNVRAVALSELNARANGVTSFQAVASSKVEGLEGGPFDVALANPPYIADHSVARLFIERARELLKPRGRFFLVTKQPEAVAPMIGDVFGSVDGVPRRGYTILVA